MSNSAESCVSAQDTFRVMEKEEQTSSVSALVSRLNTCSVTDYGAGDKNDDCKSGGDDGQKDDKSMADIFPWLPKINDLCRSAVGSKNIKTLENLLTVYLQKVTSSVKDCYLKPIRAGKLKTCMNETLTFFHFLYEDIKEAVDNTLYLEKMTELMAMYVDMEIKSSRRRKEATKKVISRVTSALNIFLDRSENHILDAVMRAKYITTTDKEICSPVLEKLLKTLRTYNMQDTLYVRYLLVYKLWKKVVADATQRKEINKLAIARLQPPANFADRHKRFTNVLPRMPNAKNITTFYMQAKLNIKTACKNFMKISKDPLQPVIVDKPLFFDGRTQSTFSGKGNAFDGGVSRNLMNEIWSSFADESTTSSKKKDSSKKKSKNSLKTLADKKKKKKNKSDSFSESNSPPAKEMVSAMDATSCGSSDVKTALGDAGGKQREAAGQKPDADMPDSTTAQMSPDSDVPKPEFGHFHPFNGGSAEATATHDCAVTSRLYQEDKKPFAEDTNKPPSGILSMLVNVRLDPRSMKEEKITSSNETSIYEQRCEKPSPSGVPAPQAEPAGEPRLVAIKVEGDRNRCRSPGEREAKPAVSDMPVLNAPILDITGPVVTLQHRTAVPVITIEDAAEPEKEVYKDSDIQVGDMDLPYIEEEVVEPCLESFLEEEKTDGDNRDSSVGAMEVGGEYESNDDGTDAEYNLRYGSREVSPSVSYGVVCEDVQDRSSQGNFKPVVDRKPVLHASTGRFVPINQNEDAAQVLQRVPSSPEVSSSRRLREPPADTDPNRSRSLDFASPPPDHYSPQKNVTLTSPQKMSGLSSPHRRGSKTDNGPLVASPRLDRKSTPGIVSPPLPDCLPPMSAPPPPPPPPPQLKMLASPKSVVVKSSKPMVLSSSLESAALQSPQAMVLSTPPPPSPEPAPPMLQVFSPPPEPHARFMSAETAAMPPPPRPPAAFAPPDARDSYYLPGVASPHHQGSANQYVDVEPGTDAMPQQHLRHQPEMFHFGGNETVWEDFDVPEFRMPEEALSFGFDDLFDDDVLFKFLPKASTVFSPTCSVDPNMLGGRVRAEDDEAKISTSSYLTEDEDPTACQQCPSGARVYHGNYDPRAVPSELANALPPDGIYADASQYNSTCRYSISETCDTDALDHSGQMSKDLKNSVSYVSSYANESARSYLRTQNESRDSKSLTHPSVLAGMPSTQVAALADQSPSSHCSKLPTEQSSLQDNSTLLNCSAETVQVKSSDDETAVAAKASVSRGGMFSNNVSGRPLIPFTGPATHIPSPYQTIPPPRQLMCRCRRCYIRMYQHMMILRYNRALQANNRNQSRMEVYQYQPASVAPPLSDRPPSDAEENERIRRMVKEYEMKQAAEATKAAEASKLSETSPELTDEAVRQMVKDYEMVEASKAVKTSQSTAQDEQIRKMLQEYEMKQASEGRNSNSNLEADNDDSLETDLRTKSDLHSTLPPKKRHKAMHIDLTPVVASFPSYPTRPMMSIAELEEERLKHHHSILHVNNAQENAKKREEIIARYKKPAKVDFSKLKPSQSVIQKIERPIERPNGNPKGNQPARCNPAHSRNPSENNNCVLGTETAGRTFKTPAQLKEHTFSNRQNIYQVNPSYNVDRQIIYPLDPTTMIVTKWIYEDKTNLKPNNPVDLLDLSYSSADTATVSKGPAAKANKSKEKASSSTRSSKRKNQTGSKAGPSDGTETKRRR